MIKQEELVNLSHLFWDTAETTGWPNTTHDRYRRWRSWACLQWRI